MTDPLPQPPSALPPPIDAGRAPAASTPGTRPLLGRVVSARRWALLWALVAIALVALLSFNARLDTFLWCATRWAVGDCQYYHWAQFQKAHASDATPSFYMTAAPPLDSQFYARTQNFWAGCKEFGEARTMLVIAALVVCCYRRQRLMGLGLAAGAGIAGGLAGLISGIAGRYRPTHTDATNHWEWFRGLHNTTDLSFPSGHSTIAFATAAGLSYLFPRFRVLFITVAACTAISRVVQEAHFWSEALLGSALGWTIGWLCMEGMERVLERYRVRRTQVQ